MSGHINGARAHIQKIQPLADFYHCASHKLNLSLNSTSKVPEFRILMENITKLGLFLKYSPKRQLVVEKEVLKAHPPLSVTKVNQLLINVNGYNSYLIRSSCCAQLDG